MYVTVSTAVVVAMREGPDDVLVKKNTTGAFVTQFATPITSCMIAVRSTVISAGPDSPTSDQFCGAQTTDDVVSTRDDRLPATLLNTAAAGWRSPRMVMFRCPATDPAALTNCSVHAEMTALVGSGTELKRRPTM